MFLRLGKVEIYGARFGCAPWAWLALVLEGPSLEAVVWRWHLIVSWGPASDADRLRVWALRRARSSTRLE